MAELEDLLQEISEPELRSRLAGAIRDLKRHRRFGLVYERHIPELAVLPQLPVETGSFVVHRTEPGLLYRVIQVQHDATVVEPATGGALKTFPIGSLHAAKRFGDPIFPTLRPVGEIARAAGRPVHPVINGENYHALQLLRFLYAGQVDCIYVDGPYNTGAKDWKYNNRYVDANDAWRHSKWLAFMEKRLRLARTLLKPDGVLIATIDEHEVHHLGMLLEDLFPDAYRQMVTIVINPKGVTQDRFSRVEEFAFFCFLGDSTVKGLGDDLLTPLPEETELADSPRWKGLLRSGTNAARRDRQNLFFPVFVDENRGAVVRTGEPLPLDEEPDLSLKMDGLKAVWPIRRDGSLGNWSVGHKTLQTLIDKGYVALGGFDERRKTYGITYLSRRYQEQIESGVLVIKSRDEKRNVVDVRYVDPAQRRTKTVWHRSSHDAGAYGTDLLRKFLGEGRRFPFPKSVYAVRDSLAAVVGNRPNALIVDFFAGSGTTLHATALLNAHDGGSRRCILITNNEVDERTARDLHKNGHAPGDEEFEKLGIFQSATRPRIEAAITGRRSDGEPIEGDYTWADFRPYKDGFDENVSFFDLTYLDADAIDLNLHFDDLIPVLWLAAGGQGPLPTREDFIDGMLVSHECGLGVLVDESRSREFAARVQEDEGIKTVFLLTDSPEAFSEMRALFGQDSIVTMLYRDYLRHFNRPIRNL